LRALSLNGRGVQYSAALPPGLKAHNRRTEFIQYRGGLMSKLDQEDRDDISGRQFAFPKQRKEPLEDASHVRNAIARFDQVKDVTDHERDEAWTRIRAAAKKFGVEVNESDWREVGSGKKDKH
jgi:hypothetical protein